MKKFVLLSIMMVLLLCGCGKTTSNMDFDGAVAAVDKKYGDMVEISTNELEGIYKLDTSLMDKYSIKSSSNNDGSLYAIIKVSDSNKTEVKNEMSEMFSILENQSNLYSPDAVKLLKNRLETSVGDYLIYIVSDDNQAVYDVIKGYVD